jgi:hypothetical protein
MVGREGIFKLAIAKLVMIKHRKIAESKVRCPHIIRFVHLLGHHLMEDSHSSVLHGSTLILAISEAAISKRRSHRLHMERFRLKKLNDVRAKGRYRVGT